MKSNGEVVTPLEAKKPKRSAFIEMLALRETYREKYWNEADPIVNERLLWRAQSIRHTIHLLPGQTILEIGCGGLRLTRIMKQVSRGENPITAITFQEKLPELSENDSGIEVFAVTDLPGDLKDRQFDCIVLMDLLDRANSPDLLSII